MSIPMQQAQALLAKIQSLPAERVAEVEDFVDFLRERTACREEAAARYETLDFPVDDPGP